jgi:6-phosphogluconate dehydrogenase (decarboxylating)
MKTIGIIGLGRMGYNMAERLLQHNISVVAYNRNQDKVRQIAKKGAKPASSVEDLVRQLKGQKIIWLMLPAGKVTDDMIKELLPLMKRGDILVDGANDFYGNAQRHSTLAAKRGVHFFDAGVSGGIWGLKNGYTLMVGGPKAQFKILEPFCREFHGKRFQEREALPASRQRYLPPRRPLQVLMVTHQNLEEVEPPDSFGHLDPVMVNLRNPENY